MLLLRLLSTALCAAVAACVFAFVYVTPHGTWRLVMRDVRNENGDGVSSPCCSSSEAQSIVVESSRAGVPVFLYFLGTIDPKRVEAAQREGADPLPSLHSDLYFPVPDPSIRTGVLTMSLAVLNLVGKE